MLRTTTQKGFIFEELISLFSRKFPDQSRFRTGTSLALDASHSNQEANESRTAIIRALADDQYSWAAVGKGAAVDMGVSFGNGCCWTATLLRPRKFNRKVRSSRRNLPNFFRGWLTSISQAVGIQ